MGFNKKALNIVRTVSTVVVTTAGSGVFAEIYDCELVDFVKSGEATIFGIEPAMGSMHQIAFTKSQVVLELNPFFAGAPPHSMRFTYLAAPESQALLVPFRNGFYVTRDELFGLATLSLSESFDEDGNVGTAASAVMTYASTGLGAPLVENWLFNCQN